MILCAGCGGRRPYDSPICSTCRRKLAGLCYGKTRHFRGTALTIEDRERLIPGKENTHAYECPVCRQWHTGRTSMVGEARYADAVLICLRLARFYGEFLAELVEQWRPEVADRTAWRAANLAARERHGREVNRAGDHDPLPA